VPDDHRRIGRHGGQKIETRRTFALIGRQRQIGPVRERITSSRIWSGGLAHGAVPASAAADADDQRGRNRRPSIAAARIHHATCR